MKLSNWKIGTRLALGFAVVLVIMVVMSIIGINRLSEINAASTMMAEDRVPKVLMVQEIHEQVNVVARASRNTLLLKDKDQVRQEVSRILQARKIITEKFDELDKRMVTPKGREMIKATSEKRAQYVAAVDKLMKLLDDGKKDEGVDLLMGEVRKAQAAYLGQLDDFQKYLTEMMNKANKEASDMYAFARMLLIGLTAAAFMLGMLIAYLVTRTITRPLNEAVKIAETIASGDLTHRIVVHSNDETGHLMQALKNMNESLVSIVDKVRTGTDTIATASAQIASGNQDLSSRTEEQASSLEETASSMEELTSTVRQNADNARQANQLAVNASDIAVKGGAVVGQVVETMNEIDASSKKIADIISVIDGIAFQTNILALNAAVEAARAGEQGRGFAVVASEVRNLAQRSASAAREIKTLIDDSVEKVETGSKLVGEAGATMDEIVSSIRRVHDIMGEITAASNEQSEGIEQVNQAIVQMDQVTQQNAALVEEAAAAAEALQEQSRNLVTVVSVFRTGDKQMAQPALPSKSNAAAMTAKKDPAPVSPQQAALPAPKKVNAGKTPSDDWEEF